MYVKRLTHQAEVSVLVRFAGAPKYAPGKGFLIVAGEEVAE
jgi:hypothetical protein